MPIKEKSSFRKYEFEYTSPDGDSCEIVIVDAGDRRYVQFRQSNGDVVTMDGPMLLDMADKYREVMRKHHQTVGMGAPVSRDGVRLPAPRLVDHRVSLEKGEMPAIEEEVMSSRKVGSVDYAKVQSGVDHESLEPVGETPSEWMINRDEEVVGWKREALERASRPQPRFKQRGASGQGFKRIGAGDLI